MGFSRMTLEQGHVYWLTRLKNIYIMVQPRMWMVKANAPRLNPKHDVSAGNVEHDLSNALFDHDILSTQGLSICFVNCYSEYAKAKLFLVHIRLLFPILNGMFNP